MSLELEKNFKAMLRRFLLEQQKNKPVDERLSERRLDRKVQILFNKYITKFSDLVTSSVSRENFTKNFPSDVPGLAEFLLNEMMSERYNRFFTTDAPIVLQGQVRTSAAIQNDQKHPLTEEILRIYKTYKGLFSHYLDEPIVGAMHSTIDSFEHLEEHWLYSFLKEHLILSAQQCQSFQAFKSFETKLNSEQLRHWEELENFVKTYNNHTIVLVSAIFNLKKEVNVDNFHAFIPVIHFCLLNIVLENQNYVNQFEEFLNRAPFKNFPELEKEVLACMAALADGLMGYYASKLQRLSTLNVREINRNTSSNLDDRSTLTDPHEIYESLLFKLRRIKNYNPANEFNEGSKKTSKNRTRKANRHRDTAAVNNWVAKESEREKEKETEEDLERQTAEYRSTYTMRFLKNNTKPFQENLEQFKDWTQVQHRPLLDKKKTMEAAWHEFDKKQYDQARALFLSLINFSKSNSGLHYLDATYGLACCEIKNENYREAAACFETILLHEPYKSQYEIHMELLDCYQKSHQYSLAIKQANNMLKVWNNDRKLIQMLANSYIATGESYCGLSLHAQICASDNSAQAQIQFARAYIRINNYSKALEILTTIPADKWNKSVVHNLAYCYIRTGKIQLALNILGKGLERFPENQLPMLDCYISTLIEAKEHRRALEKLNQVSALYPDNPIILSLYGLYFQAIGEGDNVLAHLYKIQNSSETKPYIISRQIYLWVKMGHYDKAMECAKALTSWHPNDALGYIELKRLEELLQDLDTKVHLESYDKLLAQFPDTVQIYLKKAKFLLSLQDKSPSTEEFLRAAIDRFPHEPRLYVLLAEHYENCTRYEAALVELKQALAFFGEIPKLRLGLLNHYRKMGEQQKAFKLEEKINRLFDKNQSIESKLHQINAKPAPTTLATYIKTTSEQAKNQELSFTLPEILAQAFEAFGDYKEKVYLVGGAVVKLVQGKSDFTDLDFTVNENIDLLKLGFKPSKYMPDVYVKKLVYQGQEISLDVKINSKSTGDESSKLKSNAAKRDYTICALFLDCHGKLYDPLKRGLTDLKAKRLATCSNAQLLLKEDPVRLLRAAKYIMEGFEPTQRLKEALLNWQCELITSLPEYSHLVAVALRQLSFATEPTNYLKILYDYNLLEKLFKDPSVSVRKIQDITSGFYERMHNFLVKTKENVVDFGGHTSSTWLSSPEFGDEGLPPLIEIDSQESAGFVTEGALNNSQLANGRESLNYRFFGSFNEEYSPQELSFTVSTDYRQSY